MNTEYDEDWDPEADARRQLADDADWPSYALSESAAGRDPMREEEWYMNHVWTSLDGDPAEELSDWERYMASRHR